MPSAYTTTLADIQNPHRLLIRTERHDDINTLGHHLYLDEELYAQNYRVHFVEGTDDHKKHAAMTMAYAREVYKAGGAFGLYDYVSNLGSEFYLLQLVTLLHQHELKGFKVNYCDDPVLRDTKLRIEVEQHSQTRVNSVTQWLQHATRHIETTTKLDSLLSEGLLLSAIFGPTALSHFMKRHALPAATGIQVFMLAQELFSKKELQDKNPGDLYVAEGNHYMAKEIHEELGLRPEEEKAVATVGFSHISDTDRNPVKPEDALPVILKSAYSIDSTTVGFVDKTKMNGKRRYLQRRGIEPADVSFHEFQKNGFISLGLSALELRYLFKGNTTMAEGIYPNTDKAVGLDYLIVLPEHDDEEHIEDVCIRLQNYFEARPV